MFECDEIKSIEIGIASSDYFFKISVVEIFSNSKFGENSVYDEKMGPLDNSNCKTCFKKNTNCTGHFGHINLVEPVLNPLFTPKIISFLKIICLNCGIILNKNNKEFSKKSNICNSCKFVNYQIIEKNGVYYSNESILDLKKILCILNKMDQQVYTKFGFNLVSHPKNYIMTILPVMSHLHRPYMNQGSQICDDDLTSIYFNIIKINQKLKKKETDFNLLYEKLVFDIRTLFTNTHGKSVANHPSSGRKINSIVERFNGKNGLPRNNILGKRIDESGRAVASPGNLKTGELGLPRSLANILTRRIHCTHANIDLLQHYCDLNKIDRVYRNINGDDCEFAVAKFCNKKQTKLEPLDIIIRQNSLPINVETGREILLENDVIIRNGQTIKTTTTTFRKFEIKIGDYVCRYLQDDDLILANRQPTLHTGSMTAMNIKIHDDHVITLPLSLTHRLNLDFDGDEVNIHSIQSEEALKELKEIAHANKTIISSSTNLPFITVVQDTVIGLYFLSESCFEIDTEIFTNQELNTIFLKSKNNFPTSFDLISYLFPNDFYFKTKSFEIKNGLWVSGICNKQATLYIINEIYKKYGSESCCNLIDWWQNKVVFWLTIRGYSINGDDFKPFNTEYIENKIKNFSNYENERTIRDLLHQESIESFPDNNILKCINSGAKGTLINFGQIISCIGQQKYGKNSKIISTLSKNRIIPSDDYSLVKTNYDKLIYHGFIQESYASGLKYRSMALSSFTSRYCLILGKHASSSGYLQRQAGKSLEDICIEYKNGNPQVINKSSFNPYVIMLNYNNNLNPFY